MTYARGTVKAGGRSCCRFCCFSNLSGCVYNIAPPLCCSYRCSCHFSLPPPPPPPPPAAALGVGMQQRHQQRPRTPRAMTARGAAEVVPADAEAEPAAARTAASAATRVVRRLVDVTAGMEHEIRGRRRRLPALPPRMTGPCWTAWRACRRGRWWRRSDGPRRRELRCTGSSTGERGRRGTHRRGCRYFKASDSCSLSVSGEGIVCSRCLLSAALSPCYVSSEGFLP